MADDKDANAGSYDQAREITEKALEAYVNDDQKKGDELVEEAKRVDEHAVQDVSAELEEDAPSEHDPAKLNDEINQRKRG